MKLETHPQNNATLESKNLEYDDKINIAKIQLIHRWGSKEKIEVEIFHPDFLQKTLQNNMEKEEDESKLNVPGIR